MHCENCSKEVYWSFVSSFLGSNGQMFGTQMLKAETGNENRSRFFCKGNTRHSLNGITERIL